ncbi:MAG: neutral zinc metallopeptidase [Burkholderiales bacterium]|nr:neutral zinc metallopeptidase [Burkholderiales bacterium]
MKWEGQDQSDNVEDRRDGGGGLGGSGIGGRHIGIGSVVIALLAGWAFGINPLTVLGLLGGGSGAPVVQQAPAHKPPPGDREAVFVSVVLRDTEQVWGQIFQAAGGRYEDPRLVLFRGATPTACGTGQSAMGPFYCPGDRKVYLDLDFFDTLSRRLGAPGQFAQAYVIAHEVGHHVQNLMGITAKVEALRSRQSTAQANATSVRLELQADCLAGVWAFHSQQGKGWLEAGDIEQALNAASQIGDDTLQRESRGTVVPESFTHGSSAQRVDWFKRGLAGGQVNACNTFQAAL